MTTIDLSAIQPPLPDLGSPVVGLRMTSDHDVQIYETLKPVRPERAVWEYPDDDEYSGAVYVRDLTDEEYEAALERWRVAVEDWKRTNGRMMTSGPMRYDLEVELEDGRHVTLVGDGKTWRLVAETWSSICGRSLPPK